jgi:hypothetical protein
LLNFNAHFGAFLALLIDDGCAYSANCHVIIQNEALPQSSCKPDAPADQKNRDSSWAESRLASFPVSQFIQAGLGWEWMLPANQPISLNFPEPVFCVKHPLRIIPLNPYIIDGQMTRRRTGIFSFVHVVQGLEALERQKKKPGF